MGWKMNQGVASPFARAIDTPLVTPGRDSFGIELVRYDIPSCWRLRPTAAEPTRWCARPPQLIVNLSIDSFADTMQLAPAFVGGLFWKRANRTGALASMLVGIAVFCITNWVLDESLRGGFHPGLLGLGAGSLVLVLGSLLGTTPTEEQKRAEAIVAVT